MQYLYLVVFVGTLSGGGGEGRGLEREEHI